MLQPCREEDQRSNLWTNLHRCIRPAEHRSKQFSRISTSEPLRPELSLLTTDIVELCACGGVPAIVKVQHTCEKHMHASDRQDLDNGVCTL